MGTFVKIGTMADGTPRIVLDLQCKLEDVAAMGLIPGVPFALARLKKEAAVTPSEAPKEKPGPLCVMACNFCEDPMFWKWIGSSRPNYPSVNDAEGAKKFICELCSVDSRKAIDQSASAAFHSLIRKPFLAWRDSANPNARFA
jgi:hypothetical protein